MFPVEYNKFVKPSFLADGRLVYCPENGGIAITNADYSSSKTIYSNPLNAFAVSPDGQTIAFSEGIDFYTMRIDGSGKRKVECDGEPLQVNKAENVIDMGWSPDGKYFAFTFKDGGNYDIVIVPLDGGSYRYLKDADGEILKKSGQLMNWH